MKKKVAKQWPVQEIGISILLAVENIPISNKFSAAYPKPIAGFKHKTLFKLFSNFGLIAHKNEIQNSTHPTTKPSGMWTLISGYSCFFSLSIASCLYLVSYGILVGYLLYRRQTCWIYLLYILFFSSSSQISSRLSIHWIHTHTHTQLAYTWTKKKSNQ